MKENGGGVERKNERENVCKLLVVMHIGRVCVLRVHYYDCMYMYEEGHNDFSVHCIIYVYLSKSSCINSS